MSRITNMIEEQIERLQILGLEPAAIQIHEEFFDEFIFECSKKISKTDENIGLRVMTYRGLDVTQVNYSKVQFDGSKGFIAPIQITVKSY